MFSPSNYTLPQDEAQGSDMQLQTDVGMKVEYTEVINSSDADKIIEYEIITVGELEDRTFTTLENYVPNGAYNDNPDLISRCKMSIEGLSPSSYNDKMLSDGTFNDSKDSISRCKMSIEELSPSSYNNKILSDGTFNDSKDSISRCKMSIEELSPSSYNDKILSDGTFNDSKDSISRCKMSIEELSPLSYNNKILSDDTFNDSKDSISRCKMSIEELSPLSYNDKILSDGTFNDSKDSISKCKISIEKLSPSSYNDKILSDGSFNDSKDSISRCKMSIEELSPLSYNNKILSDDTFNDSKDSISRCKMSIEELSPLSYNDKILSDGTFNDSKDSISKCKISIEKLSPSSYNDKTLFDSAFNDNKDSISRCKMSIEELSPSSYNDQILSDVTFNDSKDSISRCKMSIEELSPSSYDDKILSDGTFNDNKDFISRCKMSIEELSPSNYNGKILSDVTFNDSKDSISRCKMSIEELSPSSYNDKILSDGTFNDNKDFISRCKMSIEELSPSSNTNHVFKVESENLCLDHLIECVIDDAYEENKQRIEAEVGLDDAFRQCLIEINSDLSNDDYNFDNILKQLNENGSSTETNHKRKISPSVELIATDNDNNINCKCGIPKNQSYFEITKNIRIVDDMIHISEKSPKSCQEIYHNIFFDESEIQYFRKTYEKFLQKSICLTLPQQIDKCIECCVYNIKSNLTKRDYDSITCRFYAFRQLRYKKSGRLAVAGYPDPHKHIENIDLSMWLPSKHTSDPSDFNIQASTKILGDAGGQFCMFVKDEIDALKLNLPYNGKQRKILWKKCVNGVREMCDVCRTTIFNHHWCCCKCGFVVCVDCFKAKLKNTRLTEKQTIVQRNFNKKIWLLCSNQKEHQIDKLFITQILAGNALKCISELMHETCRTYNIPLNCCCNETLVKIFPSNSTDTVFDNLLNIYEQFMPDNKNDNEEENLGLNALINKQCKMYLEYGDESLTEETDESESEDSTSIPRNNVEDSTSISRNNVEDSSSISINNVEDSTSIPTNNVEDSTSISRNNVEDSSSISINNVEDSSSISINNVEDSTSIPRNNVEDTIYSVRHIKRKELFPPKLSLLSNDKVHAPYMWLCEGHLLRLLDPKSDINYTIFQDQWRRGQPVLVSDVGNKLNSSLWHPESFSRDFGNQINDLINCTTSDVISDQPMSRFWNGFENSEERLCDKQGNVMLLKLKDWPPSADFAETLPDRFQDLMNCLPLKEYTHRNGKYNLASRLPDCYVRPDLGPKMYTAYGNAGTTHKKVGTTNLHLDISDAVNVMVYVAITKNCKEYDYNWHVREALQVIEEAGCDDLTLRRIYVHGEIPGALWHIYHASDADSIRDLLIKVAVEHGKPLEQFSDPIHDQSHYLDEYLRERLYREYGIKGYAIVQYYGDAVFIPAGAPHQVRNLHNCIKVAEDFVSPENVHHSFRMTQEFRHLTDSHTNHEDKLQIKNIVFHAIKDSISVLTHTSHIL